MYTEISTAQAKEDAGELLQKKGALEKEKKQLEDDAKKEEVELQKKLKTVGNYVHDSVPVSANEVRCPDTTLRNLAKWNSQDDNALLRTWAPEGVKVEKRKCLSHHDVLLAIDGYDPARGVKVAGHRGYCLTTHGYFLNMALINYASRFLYERDYKPCQPPYFMLRDQMAKTAQLEQFDEELYKVSGDAENDTDKYLIATSEQPISAMHAGEWLQDKDLPIK